MQKLLNLVPKHAPCRFIRKKKMTLGSSVPGFILAEFAPNAALASVAYAPAVRGRGLPPQMTFLFASRPGIMAENCFTRPFRCVAEAVDAADPAVSVKAVNRPFLLLPVNDDDGVQAVFQERQGYGHAAEVAQQLARRAVFRRRGGLLGCAG